MEIGVLFMKGILYFIKLDFIRLWVFVIEIWRVFLDGFIYNMILVGGKVVFEKDVLKLVILYRFMLNIRVLVFKWL